jgi:adenylate cyclase
MPDLIAQGTQPDQRWRRKLLPDARVAIGRQAGAWSTPWDDRISRRHVVVVYEAGRLHVEAMEAARNPVFYRGQKSSRFSLQPGEHFVIGQTTFTLVDEQVHVSLDLPQPAGERTFSVEELRRQPFREADKRIDVLSRLPETISGAASDQELFERLVNLLLSGISRATAAAIVSVSSKFKVQGSKLESEKSTLNFEPETLNSEATLSSVDVLHWDRRIIAGTRFQPSERLIRQAVVTRESVAHVWNPGQAKEGQFTLSEGVDWAFCTPVPGKACEGWALYVTGSFVGDFGAPGQADAEALRDEVKFTELAAATLSSLRESRLLAARQASLSQFFSPVVLEALASQDHADALHDALAPREADVTVLFCDLRGFTAKSEQAAGDLFGLLNRVSQALGVMTRNILEQGGVVGDFHGDAAMGFWGWPIAQPDSVERACRAALGIRAAFGLADGLSDFRVGIGMASGRAVAGKIGTVDQVKVTVFGPVVNLASRLETMTRQLRASILIDPPTAAVIRATVPREVCRVRRLALVRPVGLSAPIEVSELLPPLGDNPELTDEHLASYEAALVAFQSRDWPLALKHLHAVPPDDQAKDFLTLFIAQHARTPPPHWDGSIPLEGK